MQYLNPIICCDYSDPDVIRVGKYFYLVASSFNYVPGVPVLRSENLVEWEQVGNVIKKLPFGRFDRGVCRGDGAWAPSIRFHGGKFYCVIPFPDDGIYVAETEDPCGEWSPLRPLIKGRGIIDPCPIWDGDRCYLAVAFARSRAGFNSAIGLYEVTPDLTSCVSDGYKIIYDGHNNNPIIEGPKLYKRGKYFYVLAPAGSVKSGWQVALRSENIYGPYESKVILMQGDSLVNGPHQGALVDAPDGRDWFIHFQDLRAYGRITHLQPVTWQDGFPICGRVKYDGIAGTPVVGDDYPVDIKTDCTLPENDDFSGKELSPQWQFPANPQQGWYSLGGGLKLYCKPFGEQLEDLPCALTCKPLRKNFSVECSFGLCGGDGDEAGFGITGRNSAYVCVRSLDGVTSAFLCRSGADGYSEVPLQADCGRVKVEITVVNKNIFEMHCTFKVNGREVAEEFVAEAGDWVGARFALFARNKKMRLNGGYSLFNYFKIK